VVPLKNSSLILIASFPIFSLWVLGFSSSDQHPMSPPPFMTAWASPLCHGRPPLLPRPRNPPPKNLAGWREPGLFASSFSAIRHGPAQTDFAPGFPCHVPSDLAVFFSHPLSLSHFAVAQTCFFLFTSLTFASDFSIGLGFPVHLFQRFVPVVRSGFCSSPCTPTLPVSIATTLTFSSSLLGVTCLQVLRPHSPTLCFIVCFPFFI